MFHWLDCRLPLSMPLSPVMIMNSHIGKLMTGQAHVLLCIPTKSRHISAMTHFYSLIIRIIQLAMNPFEPCIVQIFSYCAVYRSVSIRHILSLPHSPASRRVARHVCHPYSSSSSIVLPIVSSVAHCTLLRFTHTTHLASSIYASAHRSFLNYPLHCFLPLPDHCSCACLRN